MKDSFLKTVSSLKTMALLRDDDKKIFISIEDCELNMLIGLLSQFDVIQFSNRKETLEDYFMKFYKEDKDFGGALK